MSARQAPWRRQGGDCARASRSAAGADVNGANPQGETALMAAAEHGHQSVVQALLAAKADVNAQSEDGRTPLMRASYAGHLAVVRALLDAHADVDAQNETAATALVHAVAGNHVDVVKVLLAAKADPEAKWGGWQEFPEELPDLPVYQGLPQPPLVVAASMRSLDMVRFCWPAART